jgi:hypothetical protein
MLCTWAPPPGTVNPNLIKLRKLSPGLRSCNENYTLCTRSFLYIYYTLTHNRHKTGGHTTNRGAEIKWSVTKLRSFHVRWQTVCVTQIRIITCNTSYACCDPQVLVYVQSVLSTTVVIVNTSAIYRQKCKQAWMQLKLWGKKVDLSGSNFISQFPYLTIR